MLGPPGNGPAAQSYGVLPDHVIPGLTYSAYELSGRPPGSTPVDAMGRLTLPGGSVSRAVQMQSNRGAGLPSKNLHGRLRQLARGTVATIPASVWPVPPPGSPGISPNALSKLHVAVLPGRALDH